MSVSSPTSIDRRDAGYLFYFLLLANLFQYMEAGAVPALLVTIAESFDMDSGQQGLLGGVVYLSLGIGGPFAGYLLKKYEHKLVVGGAVIFNMIFTILWALTPVGQSFSTLMFITMRFMMGLCQCIVCVYLPLWTNENAPRDKRTTWMSYLQASVPLGVMLGYIVASVFMNAAEESVVCGELFCWRWPFLIEIFLLAPLYAGLYFVPVSHMDLAPRKSSSSTASGGSGKVSQPVLSPLSDDIDATEGTAGAAADDDDLESSPLRTPVKDASAESMSLDATDNHINRQQSRSVSPKMTAGYAAASRRTSDADTNEGSRLVTKSVDRNNHYKKHVGLMLQEDLSEKRKRMSLRRHSMNASMFDPLSIRDVIRRSHDDLTVYSNGGDFFDLLPDFSWNLPPSRGSSRGGSLEGGQVAAVPPSLHDGHRGVVADEEADGDGREHTPSSQSSASPVRGAGAFGSVQRPTMVRMRQSYPLRGQQRRQLGGGAGYGSIPELTGDDEADCVAASNDLGEDGGGIFEGDNSDEENGAVYRTKPPRRPSHSTTATNSNASPKFKYESLRDLQRRSTSGNNRRRTSSSASFYQANSGPQSPVTLTAAAPSSSANAVHDVAAAIELTHQQPQLALNDGNASSDSHGPGSAPTGPMETTLAMTHTDSNYSFDYGSGGSDSESDSDWFSPVKSAHPYRITESTSQQPPRVFFPSDDPAVGIMDPHGASYVETPAPTTRVPQRRRKAWHKALWKLMSIGIYRNILGAMTCLYFTVTGVQYWGTKYLSIALHAPLPVVNTLFVLCAATGPTLGVFFGGWLVDSLGGYHGRKRRCQALRICCILGIFGACGAVPITFLENIYLVTLLLWMSLFFGGATLPACSGILVSIVPRDYRPLSSSVSMVVFNMFGYFASLIVSGYLMEWLESQASICDAVCSMTWGFRLILGWSCFSVLFIILAYKDAYAQLIWREEQRQRMQAAFFA